MFSQVQGNLIKFKNFNVESGASLYELSGKMHQYKNMNIVENPNKEKPLRISTNKEDIFLERTGNNYSDFNQKEIGRFLIKLAIENHFEKQFSIL